MLPKAEEDEMKGTVPSWAVAALFERLVGVTDPAARGAEVQQVAQRYGTSRATVYRRLAAYEGRQAELRVTEDERRWGMEIAGYLRLTMNQKGIAPATHTAIAELARLGKIPAGCLSRQRADLVLASLGLTKAKQRSPKPCVRLTAPGPNTWGQADATVASAYYLENMWLGHASEYRKNSPVRTKVLLCSYVDVFSGCVFARMYEAIGESAEVVVQFMHEAWREKPDLGFPMHGLPWALYTDQGPAWKAKHVQTLLDSCLIDWHGHLPGNARATGLVERRFLDTARFEAMLRGRLAFGHKVHIDEVNSWLHEWCVEQNNRPHVLDHSKTRFEAWSTIKDEEIRRAPAWDNWVHLTAVGENRRKVNAYMAVSVSGSEYYLGIPDLVGEYVDVYQGVDGQLYVRHHEKVYGPLKAGVPVNVLGIDARRAPLSEGERNLREAVRAVSDIGMRPIDVAFVRGEKADIFLPRSGREVAAAGVGPALAELARLDQVREVRTELEAKDWLVARFGSLTALGWEALAAVERTIKVLLEQDGKIAVADLEKVLAVLQKAEEKSETRMTNEEAMDDVDVVDLVDIRTDSEEA